MEPFMSVIQIQKVHVAPNMVGVEVMLSIVLVRLALIIGQEIDKSQLIKEFQNELIKMLKFLQSPSQAIMTLLVITIMITMVILVEI